MEEISFAEVALLNIENAIKILDGIPDNTHFQVLQLSITTAINNAIHSIVDYYERMEKGTLEPEEDTLLRAFMYVNNQLKHDKNLRYITYNISGSMFPFMFPFRFGPPGVIWADFVDNGSLNARGKRCHYEDALLNKDVSDSLKRVQVILSGKK